MIILLYLLILWTTLGAAWLTFNMFLYPEKIAAAYAWNQSKFLPFWNHPKSIPHKIIVLGVLIYGIAAIFSFWWCVSYFMPFPHGSAEGYIGGRLVFSFFLSVLNLGALSAVKHMSCAMEQNENLRAAIQNPDLSQVSTPTSQELYPYRNELAKLEKMETTQ